MSGRHQSTRNFYHVLLINYIISLFSHVVVNKSRSFETRIFIHAAHKIPLQGIKIGVIIVLLWKGLFYSAVFSAVGV